MSFPTCMASQLYSCSIWCLNTSHSINQKLTDTYKYTQVFIMASLKLIFLFVTFSVAFQLCCLFESDLGGSDTK